MRTQLADVGVLAKGLDVLAVLSLGTSHNKNRTQVGRRG
jgi:hypothetical protein